jgi:outer membrane protein assembly factor BamB
MQTPILVGEHLYACLDNGVVTCFDAQTGAIRYSERMGDGLQGFTTSPVSDGHTILFASETGNLFRLPADGTFRPLPPVAMKETILATPALSDGILYLRTRDHLVAIGR